MRLIEGHYFLKPLLHKIQKAKQNLDSQNNCKYHMSLSWTCAPPRQTNMLLTIQNLENWNSRLNPFYYYKLNYPFLF